MAPVAVLCEKLGTYHLARFGALAQVADIRVIEVASLQHAYSFWEDHHAMPFPVTTLFPGQAIEEVSPAAQCEQMVAALAELGPAAVVTPGYSQPVMRAAAGWARRQGVPSVMLCASTAGDHRRNWLKERLKRHLVRSLFDAAFVGGQRHAAYVETLGIPADRIWRFQNVVDNEHFSRGAALARAQGDPQRESLDLPEHYFLWVGRMVGVKNLPVLLAAYERYRRLGGPWGLVLVGDGALRTSLQQQAERQGVRGIVWPGMRRYAEIPAYYAFASCFVLPSVSEPWGAVVNEAMACGLPVLVSDVCGCVPELVHRGINGWNFDPRDPHELSDLMLRVSSGSVDLAACGEASRRIVNCYTPATWAQALCDCLATLGAV